MSNKFTDKQNVIADLMDGILLQAQKETRENQKERINKLSAILTSPDDFDIHTRYKWEGAVQEALRVKYPKISSESLNNLSFLFSNYNYVDSNISALVEREEGRACSADKSGFIIRSLVKYFTDNTPFDLSINEKTYWKPKILTAEAWIKFYKGLISFYYGNPLPYLDCMKDLIVEKTVKNRNLTKK